MKFRIAQAARVHRSAHDETVIGHGNGGGDSTGSSVVQARGIDRARCTPDARLEHGSTGVGLPRSGSSGTGGTRSDDDGGGGVKTETTRHGARGKPNRTSQRLVPAKSSSSSDNAGGDVVCLYPRDKCYCNQWDMERTARRSTMMNGRGRNAAHKHYNAEHQAGHIVALSAAPRKRWVIGDIELRVRTPSKEVVYEFRPLLRSNAGFDIGGWGGGVRRRPLPTVPLPSAAPSVSLKTHMGWEV